MREEDLEILRYVKRARNMAGWVERHRGPQSDKPGKWGALVRKGLLRSAKQGQNPIHEPASYWSIYYLTEAGEKVLEE